jgi:uncharacterized protein (TIGR02118 family)
VYKTYFFLEGPIGSDAFTARGGEARRLLSDAVPQARGFTQTRTLPQEDQVDPQTPPPFTGIVELWFDNPDDALQSAAQANAMAGLLTETTRVGPIVTGMARTVMRLPEHHTGRFIKGVFPFRRQDHLSVEDFQRYWWLQHGPIAALTEQAVFYLQCHPLRQTYRPGRPPYDGITELHWPDVAAARTAMSSRQMTQDQSADAQNFAEPGSVVLFLAEEEQVTPA